MFLNLSFSAHVGLYLNGIGPQLTSLIESWSKTNLGMIIEDKEILIKIH